MSNHENAGSRYQILSLDELNKIETARQHEIKKSYIVDYNGAFVTIYRDGSAVVRPPVLGEPEGLLFSNVDDMNAMIASRSYPVKGNNTFWENERERVLDFSHSMPYYCAQLGKMLDMEVQFSNDSEYLSKLSGAAARALKEKKKHKRLLYAYLSIYVAELLRQKVNGEWKLKPQASLNVFYIPEIVKGNKFCTPWHYVASELTMPGFIPVDLERIIEKANEFYPIAGREYI